MRGQGLRPSNRALQRTHGRQHLAHMLDGTDQQMKAGLTSGIPAKRAGPPEEIAETIVLGDIQQAPCLTVHVITVDGAYTSQ